MKKGEMMQKKNIMFIDKNYRKEIKKMSRA